MTQEAEMKAKKNRNMIYLMIGLAIIVWFWRCPLRILGLSCPGCGMTSAFLAVFHMNFRLAFYFHPLWPLVVLIVLYFVLRQLGWFKFSESWEKKLLIIVMAAFILVYLYRLLISHSPVVEYTLIRFIRYRLFGK